MVPNPNSYEKSKAEQEIVLNQYEELRKLITVLTVNLVDLCNYTYIQSFLAGNAQEWLMEYNLYLENKHAIDSTAAQQKESFAPLVFPFTNHQIDLWCQEQKVREDIRFLSAMVALFKIQIINAKRHLENEQLILMNRDVNAPAYYNQSLQTPLGDSISPLLLELEADDTPVTNESTPVVEEIDCLTQYPVTGWYELQTQLGRYDENPTADIPVEAIYPRITPR